MKKFRFNLWLSVFLAVLLNLPCLSSANAEDQPASAEIKPSVEPEVKTAAEPNAHRQQTAVEKTAVTVNGFVITEGDIYKHNKPRLEQFEAAADQLPPGFLEQRKEQLRKQAMEMMITEHLLDERTKEKNIVITDEQALAKLKEIAAQQGFSLDDFSQAAQAAGQSLEQVQGQIKQGLAYEKLMEIEWANKIDVNETQVREYYDQNKNEFIVPEQVRASHILIKTEPADSNEVKLQKKAKAENLLEQIKEGANFARLAREHSDCSSAQTGGDLGFGRKSDASRGIRGSWVQPFERAAFSLEPNQVSGIVETQFGYHIIKVTDHKAPAVVTFEQARENIAQQLAQQKQVEFIRDYIESLKSEANIVYPDAKKAASFTETADVNKPAAPPVGTDEVK